MKRLLTLLTLTIAFAACKKEDKTITPVAPEKTAPYLSRVTYFDTLYKRELQKDSVQLTQEGNLAYVGVYDKYFELENFVYDKKGNLTEASGQMYSDGWVTLHFEYDGLGNIIERTKESNTYIIEKVSYSYDNYNRIAKEEHTSSWYPQENVTREYSYKDGSMNPVSMTETSHENAQHSVTYLYSYDTRPNPYNTLPKIVYYMGVGELGVNNITSTSVRDANNTITKTYHYGDNNLPFNQQTNVGEEFKYYYSQR
jgi:hypothetical protein